MVLLLEVAIVFALFVVNGLLAMAWFALVSSRRAHWGDQEHASPSNSPKIRRECWQPFRSDSRRQPHSPAHLAERRSRKDWLTGCCSSLSWRATASRYQSWLLRLVSHTPRLSLASWPPSILLSVTRRRSRCGRLAR